MLDSEKSWKKLLHSITKTTAAYRGALIAICIMFTLVPIFNDFDSDCVNIFRDGYLSPGKTNSNCVPNVSISAFTGIGTTISIASTYGIGYNFGENKK